MQTRQSRTRTALAAGGTVGFLVSIVVAFSTGPEPGVSGGPIGYQTAGGNCTLCHEFNAGPGLVELLGAPARYRPGAAYDLTIRPSDAEQAGAGFEMSAEGGGQHQGSFELIDPLLTRFADPDYVSHSKDGVDDSIANWAANGGSYDYRVRWIAPAMDAGSVTLYVASEAINDGSAYLGDRFYSTWATLSAAIPGDVDGDEDADLRDAAAMQRCFGQAVAGAADPCQYADADTDDFVWLEDAGVLVESLTGPTATLPAAYVQADAVRGGLLYDKWWPVSRTAEPTGDHPLYPMAGQQAGSATFRCKECHGWDYKGVDGAYGDGSHFTGIGGVAGTTLTAQQIFDLLKGDPMEVTNGHDMDAYGMTDRDIWDVVKMTLEGVVDTDAYIDSAGIFIGNEGLGSFVYSSVCVSCHDSDGRAIDFGTAGSPEYVGTIANDNPWEFLHKVRFGHPGSPMPGTDLLQYDAQLAADIGLYAQTTLPVD